MIVVDSDNTTARKAIAMALKEDRPDILTTGVDNPSWGTKSAAIEAIAKLTPKEAANAFIQILKKDHLWTNHIDGGRGQIMQAFKVIILKEFGIDASSMDFFDDNARNQLIASLEKYDS